MNFEEIMQRTVNTEAKADLRSSTMVRDLNIRCPKSYHLSNSTVLKMQTQGTTAKESKPEKSRPKELKLVGGKKPVPPCFKSTEPGKTSSTDKKRKYFKKKQNRKNNTLAIGDNANAVKGKGKK